MKLKLKILLSSLLILALFASYVEAGNYRLREAKRVIPQMVVETLDQIESGLSSSAESAEVGEAQMLLSSASHTSYYFHRFKIRLMPTVAFGLRGLLELELFPIFEIEVERDAPRGWQDYHPARG